MTFTTPHDKHKKRCSNHRIMWPCEVIHDGAALQMTFELYSGCSMEPVLLDQVRDFL